MDVMSPSLLAVLLSGLALTLAGIAILQVRLIQRRILSRGRGQEVVQQSANSPPSESPGDARPFGSAIVAVSSRGYNTPNQDACRAGMASHLAIAAVADGVGGSGPRSAIVAEAAVEHVMARMMEATNPSFPKGSLDALFTELPAACAAKLRQATSLARASGDHIGTENQVPLSTLIVAAAFRDEIVLSYVGDGSAILTTGRLVVARNLLVPHWDDNANITRSVSPRDRVTPSIVRLRPSFDDGTALLIGTDGAFPHVDTGLLFDSVRSWCVTERAWHLPPDQVAEGIQRILEKALQGVRTGDDATLGLLVSRQAIEYWRQSEVGTVSSPTHGPHDAVSVSESEGVEEADDPSRHPG